MTPALAPCQVLLTSLQTTRSYSLSKSKIKKIVEIIHGHINLPTSEVTVQFVGRAKIRALNFRHRSIDKETDVLSFPAEPFQNPAPLRRGRPQPVLVTEKWDRFRKPPLSLGDIIISIPDGQKNARSIGQHWHREMAFLMVHGYLHLCGYDHMTPQEEETMTKAQRKIMKQLDGQKVWKGLFHPIKKGKGDLS